MDLRVVYLSSQTVRLWKVRMEGKTNERQGSSVYLFRSEALLRLRSWFLCLTCTGTGTFELTPACEKLHVSVLVLPRIWKVQRRCPGGRNIQLRCVCLRLYNIFLSSASYIKFNPSPPTCVVRRRTSMVGSEFESFHNVKPS